MEMKAEQNLKRLLSHAYFEERCNVCGESYPLTLYEILLQQRAQRQWQSPRPHGEAGVGFDSTLQGVPTDQLEAIAAAWERLVTTLDEKGMTVQIGTPPSGAHTHPQA
jgi:hypothetical protein